MEDAVAAYERGDHATAVRIWQSLAAKGDAAAMCDLGTYASGLYSLGSSGVGVLELAKKWCHKAADQGSSEAENSLGVLYKYGVFPDDPMTNAEA
jgi:hypothetical protein